MAAYATVPAEAEAEKPLLNRDVRVNLKTVIGGAAVASFVLGALAATVVSGAPARTNSAALYKAGGASNFAAAVADSGTKKWTCDAPYVDSTYGPSSGPLSAAGLAVWSDWPNPQAVSETEDYKFQAPRDQVVTFTLKSIDGADSLSRVTAWAFAGGLGDPGYAAVASPAGIEFPKALCTGGEFSFVDGPIVNKRSGLRGSSMPASAKYTLPNYNYGYPNGITTQPKTATVTAFVGEKWYQSTYTFSVCNADC